MQRFGEKLRTLRKQRGMTIMELADAIGYAAYSHITGVTQSVPNQASAWTTGPIRLRQGGMEHSFSGKFGSPSQIFRKKTKTYHAAAGEIRCYREQTVRLNAHRVTPVILAKSRQASVNRRYDLR